MTLQTLSSGLSGDLLAVGIIVVLGVVIYLRVSGKSVGDLVQIVKGMMK